MEQMLAELRSLRAATGIKQRVIALRMGMDEKVVSKILNGESKSFPADFETRFRAAVAELAAEEAQRTLEAAEAQARALREAAGIPPSLAA